jgi:hypothetical protein
LNVQDLKRNVPHWTDQESDREKLVDKKHTNLFLFVVQKISLSYQCAI